MLGPLLRDRRDSKVCLHVDNAAVVHIVNNQTSRCPRIMQLLRLLCSTA